MKNICILGSTGSIGTQTIEVIQHLQDIKIVGLTTNTNIELLEKQVAQLHPEKVAVVDEEKAYTLSKRLDIPVLSGMAGAIEIASMKNVQMVVNSLVGNAGLEPTMAAIQNKKDIALANKETLVTAGEIIIEQANKNGVNIYPVDSEHSAIFQCLQGNRNNPIHCIYLTASGGPFRGSDCERLKSVTVKEALKHPNWSMGQKITIDSATLMNKGLEVIEAKWLFRLKSEQIKVLVHPQSIIHSMVEYEDGSIMAQIGMPDMRVPIQYALTYPKRIKNSYPKMNFLELKDFNFEAPDLDTFSCLRLAYEAMNIGGTMPTVMNAANEVAVDAFLNEKIGFLQIPELIENTMDAYTVKYDISLQDVLDADKWARSAAKQIIRRITCP